MGIIEPYKKIDCIDINDLTRQQRILELELQMLQNEMKQVELMKSLQTKKKMWKMLLMLLKTLLMSLQTVELRMLMT